eukprot:scaffold18230_cov101-Isochrysis_galbana.AAC.1
MRRAEHLEPSILAKLQSDERVRPPDGGHDPHHRPSPVGIWLHLDTRGKAVRVACGTGATPTARRLDHHLGEGMGRVREGVVRTGRLQVKGVCACSMAG